MSRFIRSILVIAFVATIVAVGEPLPASSDPGCANGPTTNTADLSIDQVTSLSTSGGNSVVTYTLNLTNAGPCSMPKPSILDTLPPSASTATGIAIVDKNPSSWNCDTSNFPTSFTCSLNADFGTGQSNGWVTFQLTFTGALDPAGNYSNDAKIVDPTTETGCSTAVQVCDVNALNNESWGGLLLAGGSFTDGFAGQDQFRHIDAPSSLSDLLVAQIKHGNANCQGSRRKSGSPCPLGGVIAEISIDSGGTTYVSPNEPFTFTFYFSQKAYKKKPSQITIVHRSSTGDVTLSACPFPYPWVSGDVVPADGCVALRETQTLAGVTYSVIVVYTPHNDDWFGW